jgi:outer membrane protein OmpU
MKKLLVASTALLMTAGAAAADVTVGGNGRMGLHFDGEDWTFTSRVRVTFTLSGQTDNGLSFGGSIRADNAANGAAGAAGNIWVSGAFGKVMMGDVDGAAEVVAGNVSGVGLTGLGDLNDTVYFSDFVGDPVQDPTFQYTYTMSGFTFAASATDGNGAIGGRGIGGHLARQFTTYAFGFGYAGTFSGGSFKVGIGYEHMEDQLFNDDFGHIVGGGSMTFGATTVKAMVGSSDDFLGGFTQYGVSVDHTFGATTVTAFWRQNDFDFFANERALGLGVAYDLGGGAKLMAGIVNDDIEGFGDDTWGDIGLSFTF